MGDYELWCNLTPLAVLTGALIALARVKSNLIALLASILLIIVAVTLMAIRKREQGIPFISASTIDDLAWLLAWIMIGYLPYSSCMFHG